MLAGAYSYYVGDPSAKPTDIAISQLAQDVQAGKVKAITVDGNDVSSTYIDNTKKIAKKEPDAALSQTLYNYGVTKDALAKVSLNVQRASGWETFSQS